MFENNNSNYIERNKQDLFDAINADPFMGHDSKSDGAGGVGNSIFDSNSDPFANSGFQQPVQQKTNDNAIPNDPIDFVIWLGKNIILFIVNLIIGGFTTCKEILNTINVKTADSFADMFKIMIFSFGPLALFGVAFLFFGLQTETTVAFLGVIMLVGSIMDLLFSVLGMISLNLICYKPQGEKEMTQMVEKVAEANSDQLDEVVNLASEYSQSFDDIMNEVMGETETTETQEETSSDFDFPEDENNSSDFAFDTPEVEEPKEMPNYEIKDDVVPALITPAFLFNTFSPLFPAFNPKFADLKTYEQGSEEWEDLYAIVANIFADIYGCDMAGIVEKGIQLLEAKNSVKCTTLVVKKPKGKPVECSKIEEFFNNYTEDLIKIICDKDKLFGDSKKDLISASVSLSGDKYNIIISKPCKDPILLGDVYKKENVRSFMSNAKSNTPIVGAVNDLGEPILIEVSKKSQELYSALIGGGAGSGKSQFFASLASQMVAFNQPKDLQMVLCDPKGDTLFNKLYLCPQVCRLIQGATPEDARKILDMLRLMVSVESPRRQALFKQSSCANIQDYRKQGKEMPYIIVFIDEYLSVVDAMDQLSNQEYEEAMEDFKERKANGEKGLTAPKRNDYKRELANLMKVAVTKLRAAGIYFFIISHRFIGAVDPTTRQLTAFRAVLRSEKLKEEVFDKGELSGFTKKLINAGDAAIKVGEQDVESAKAMMVSLSDEETFKIFEGIAKGYYKLDCELSKEIKHLGPEYQKDFKAIKNELFGGVETINGTENEENLDSEEETLDINSNETTEEDEDPIDHIDKDGTIHLKNEKQETEEQDDDLNEEDIEDEDEPKETETNEDDIDESNENSKTEKETEESKPQINEDNDTIDWEV